MPKKRRRGKEAGQPPVPPLVDPEGPFIQGLGGEPPNSLIVEQELLSAAIRKADGRDAVTAALGPEDFYRPEHRTIFEGIVELQRQDKMPDFSQLQALLGEAVMVDIGGKPYLDALSNMGISPTQVNALARTARKFTHYRAQIVAMQSYVLAPDEERRLTLQDALDQSADGNLMPVRCDDLLRQEISVEWLVNPLFPLNAVTVVAGDPAEGKSWLSLSLAHAVSNGLPKWLDYFHISGAHKGPQPVLYVDCEAGEASMKERLEMLDRAMGTTPELYDENSRPLEFLFFPADVKLGRAIRRLYQVIRDTGARLVILDSLMNLCPDWADPHKNKDVIALLSPFRALARELHFAGDLVHHAKKHQAYADNSPKARIMGGVMMVGEPDAALSMIGLADGDKAIIPVKARLATGTVSPFRVSFLAGPDSDNKSLWLKHNGRYDMTGAESVKAEEIVLELLAHGPKMRKEVLEAIEAEGLSDRTLTRVRKKLVAEGRLQIDRVGQADRWALVGQVG